MCSSFISLFYSIARSYSTPRHAHDTIYWGHSFLCEIIITSFGKVFFYSFVSITILLCPLWEIYCHIFARLDGTKHVLYFKANYITVSTYSCIRYSISNF